jgi:hypothetical protein
MLNKSVYKTFYTLIVLLFTLYMAQAADQKINFTGYGATGLKVYKVRFSQQTYYEGKLQAEINLKKGIEAQLDLRGNSTDNSVNFREFSVKFDLFDKLKLKVGNIKKPFVYEYILNREELYTVERSIAFENVALLGYGGRSVSLMAYYKYKEKNPEFPFSYYISLYKNNSLTSGLVARGEYHYHGYALALSYMSQSRGGWVSDRYDGVACELKYEKNSYYANINLMYAQDPIVSHQRKIQSDQYSGVVYGIGSTLILAKAFKIDKHIVYSIEPVLTLSRFIPDSDTYESHVNQAMIGLNIYFTKDVRIRINGDLRLTKNEFSDYSDNESGYIIDLQVRF